MMVATMLAILVVVILEVISKMITVVLQQLPLGLCRR